LSKGLEESNAVQCLWGIEFNEEAAEAFEMNHKHSKVFVKDCNVLLQVMVTGGVDVTATGLPKPGEVECIVGGPPCQGYSVLNTHSSSQALKNEEQSDHNVP